MPLPARHLHSWPGAALPARTTDKKRNPDRYFAVAVVGHGPDHDKTMASYADAEKANPKHVKVMAFDSVTNPQDLANDLILMAGLGG